MSVNVKQAVAEAALAYLPKHEVIGIGSGTTVHYFIQCLKAIKSQIPGVVCGSIDTETRIKKLGIPVVELNSVSQIAFYFDGADEINQLKQMIKGGGGALTREKILASASKNFICLVDASKKVDLLGTFPVAVEVLPMARSFVARALVKLGGDPVYRIGQPTDNGNVILDVHNFKILNPLELEANINNIPGVIANGIFASRPADTVLIAQRDGSVTSF